MGKCKSGMEWLRHPVCSSTRLHRLFKNQNIRFETTYWELYEIINSIEKRYK